jgi:hypothetical protein
MRKSPYTLVAALFACSLVTVSAHGDQKGDVSGTGKTRSAQLRAPQVSATAAATTNSPDSEHAPVAAPVQPRPAVPVSGALSALIERQMRKNQPAIDACVAAELERNPHASGDLTMSVTVAERKVTSSAVVSDTVNSPGLRDCLLKSAPSWTFNSRGADFTWPVVVGKK